ncbi:ATP-binding protein [[Clostridium] aminophilum]|uniref:DNA replication protein DnaC n=1 Tax=[Clostridium] aminophilum TaxID=1526 RepID=A0A1I6JWY8_9FIRM|nr:ATP-binding protein [[Clostridium] aminophilum]MCR4629207.1 ATP-binding protein [Clostridium sp.]SFR83499.1 DNA replication protein DnaC [[Clostridium] aminophilum]
MGLSNAQYEAIMRIYSQRQLKSRHDLNARKAEIAEKIPAIPQMNDEVSSCAAAAARKLLAGDQNAVTKLRAQIADLKEQKEVLLKSHGYPADYLEPRYHCPDCRDTGYIDNRKCHCFREQEINLLYEQSNIRTVLEKENFSTFSYDWFDDEKKDPRSGMTARENMARTVRICQEYIEDFRTRKGNLLFTGKTGLGKTFLSNCIARELIERYHSVVYLPASQMFDIFSRDRFSYDDDEDLRSRAEYLMECDLLIIDDLGTEMINTFTVSQLFTVINERLNRANGTIISTNLPVNEMRDVFTERVMSRIISAYQIIPFFGEDIRIRRRMAENRRKS